MKRLSNILLLAAAALGLTVSGCGAGLWEYKQGETPSHIGTVKLIPVYLDNNFSVEEETALKEAITEWNGVFNGQIVIRVDGTFDGKEGIKPKLLSSYVRSEGWNIIALESTDSAVADEIEPGDGNLAFAEIRGHYMVVLTDRIGMRNLKVIAMHEMGHLLGAYHVNLHSLMYPHYGLIKDAVQCIDKITVAQVATVQNLNLNTLNYCVTPDFK